MMAAGFINPVVHQRDGNWRARRDQPIDRFDEFLGAGHVQFFAPVRVQVLLSALRPLSRSRIA
jgi:hypothetical protein